MRIGQIMVLIQLMRVIGVYHKIIGCSQFEYDCELPKK